MSSTVTRPFLAPPRAASPPVVPVLEAAGGLDARGELLSHVGLRALVGGAWRKVNLGALPGAAESYFHPVIASRPAVARASGTVNRPRATPDWLLTTTRR